MFDISRIKPESILDPVKAQKFSQYLTVLHWILIDEEFIS